MKLLNCLLLFAIVFLMAHPAYSQSRTERYECSRAKQIIGNQLLDGKSAKFECAPQMVKSQGGKVLLVRVNSKNAFGGYVGWQTWGVVFMDNGTMQAFSPEAMQKMGIN